VRPYLIDAPAIPRLRGLDWRLAIALPVAAALVMGGFIAYTDMAALAICLALLACLFILVDFRFGVVCLIIAMPISASSVMPHSIGGINGLNPLNLLLMGTLASCLLHGLPAHSLRHLVPRPLVWLYVLPFILAGLFGGQHVGEIPGGFLTQNLLSFTDFTGYLRDMVIKPLFLVLFAVLVGAAALRSQRPEQLIYPFLVSVWAMALLTIVFVLLSGASLAELSSPTSRQFFTPLGIHANDLGRLYAVAYALMLYTCAETSDLKLRMALLASMGMVVLALMLTFSRSAFLGFAIVNVLFLISRRHLGFLLLGGVLLGVLAMALPGAVYERLGMGLGSGVNAISAGRVDEIWLPLLPKVWESPLWGEGLGSIMWSQALLSDSILFVTHPHNAYLQALIDTGIIGLGLFMAYHIHLWKGFRRLAGDPSLPPVMRGFYAGAATGLLTFLIAGMAGSSLMPCLEQIFLWMAVGMLYAQQARMAEERTC